MSALVSAWSDDCFEGVSGLFSEIWGWEIEGTAAGQKDVADLYTAGVLLACTRLRVIREGERTAAFLGSVIDADKERAAAEGLKDPAAFAAAAAVMEKRLAATAAGRKSLDFNAGIVEANRILKAKMLEAGFAWQGELKLLMTSPAFQGRGFAGALVEDTFRAMRQRGVKAVILYTDSHCSWQWYEKTGWTLAAEHPWEFEGDAIRALAYWKAL